MVPSKSRPLGRCWKNSLDLYIMKEILGFSECRAHGELHGAECCAYGELYPSESHSHGELQGGTKTSPATSSRDCRACPT